MSVNQDAWDHTTEYNTINQHNATAGKNKANTILWVTKYFHGNPSMNIPDKINLSSVTTMIGSSLETKIMSISIPENTDITEVGQLISVPMVIHYGGPTTQYYHVTATLQYKGYVTGGFPARGESIDLFEIKAIEIDPNNPELAGNSYIESQINKYLQRILKEGANFDGSHNPIIGLTDKGEKFSITNTIYVPEVQNVVHCFLKGSLIKTVEGYKKIEDIHIGDKVLVFVNNQIVERKVSSIYTTIVKIKDQDNYPVCIKKNAIALNVPFQDLYVTSEHCLFLNNAFIPVYMLVNDRSICWDKSHKSFYSIYHIETEEHSIIDSNGVLSESFLNQKAWDNAAASLKVSQEFVEPLYNSILNRAIKNNIPFKGKHKKLTYDANLHIMVNKEIIYPSLVEKDKYIFQLPSATQNIMIISNASRPYDVLGPFVNDRRYLGVLIGNVYIIGKQNKEVIDIHLKDEILQGWNNIEPIPYRWTKGHALLPLKKFLEAKSMLVIEVKETGLYIDEQYVEKISA